MILAIHRFVYAQNVMTALSFAAMKGRADCLRLLIGAGADKNAKSRVSFSIFRSMLVLAFVLNWHLHHTAILHSFIFVPVFLLGMHISRVLVL